ncbi:MAG TPA: M56 family metallopeptidase [Vicinamibacterales bacterium]|nr:M56 family metallopeptidase [Vicinamibacterales bacterium]
MERLVTWLWQGTVLAAGMWALLRVWRPNAATRFAIWWTVLMSVLVLLVSQLSASARAVAAHEPALPLLPIVLPALPRAIVAIGAATWLGFAWLGLVHLAICVLHLQPIKRGCRPFPAARERRLRRWMAVRGQGRPVRLGLSDSVSSASALGFGPAIIAIRPSLLDDVDDDELDHIVLHEYAHIQRRDDWLHALQLALQFVLCVHPAVPWIARTLRQEREAACDDWVVDRTGMPNTYARCLTKVAAFELSAPERPLALGVAGRRGDLTRRIERLIAPRRVALTRLTAVPLAAAAAVLIVAMSAMHQLPPLVGSPTVEMASRVARAQGGDASASAVQAVLPTVAEPGMATAETIRARALVANARRPMPVERFESTTTAMAPPVSARADVAAERKDAADSAEQALPLESHPIEGTTPIASTDFADRGSADAVAGRTAQGAADVWAAVGQSGATAAQATADAAVFVSLRAARVGTAAGGLLKRVGTSLGKALP